MPEKSPASGAKPDVDTPTKTPGVPQDEYQASMSGAAVIDGPTRSSSTTHPTPETSVHSAGTTTETMPESSVTSATAPGEKSAASVVLDVEPDP
jgi:hypothetical protein